PIPYFGERVDDNWIFEPKIDGWRIQLIRQPDGGLEIWGRRLERKPDWTAKLRSILTPAEQFLPKGTIVDGELYSEGGRRFIPSLFARKPKTRPIIWLFDLIYHRGRFIGNLPLEKRKELLSRIRPVPPFFLTPFQPVTDLDQALNDAVTRGDEGIVIKRLDSPYELGRDGPIATHNWRKIKP
ncbi:hypothetical protein DRP53_10395, partial [candidate division WOR-3 bacterium]